MKKIIFFLKDDYYYKYFNNNLIDNINKNNDVLVLTSEKNNSKILNQKKIKTITYKTNKKSDVWIMRAIYIGLKNYKKNVINFKFAFDLRYPKINNYYRQFKSNIKFISLLKVFLKRNFFLLLSKSFLFSIFKFFFLNLVKPENNLLKIFKDFKPDLLIYPTHGAEPEFYKILLLCKNLKIKSLLIIDNWDNLTSHTFFYIKPNLLAVWGQQTKEHAIKYHNIEKNNIYTFGNPKFNNYLKLKNEKLDNPYNFKYILFIGSFVNWNEIDCLFKINEIVKINKLNLKIIYRPHPSSFLNKNKVIEHIKKNKDSAIVLDKIVEQNKNYLSNNVTNLTDKSRLYIEPVNYFESLIQNSELSIGTLSTITIEALIFRKKFMVIAYPKENHEFNPENIYKYAEYAKGLEKIELIKITKHYNLLEKEFISFYNLKINQEDINISNQINYFYDSKNINTFKNLMNMISKI